MYRTHPTICRLLLLLLCSGICQSVLFCVIFSDDPSRIFESDSDSYLHTARAFLKTGHFAINPEHPKIPQLTRTPGYPAFIAAIFFLGGEDRVAPIVLVQICLFLLTIVVFYRIALRLWNAEIAFISATFLACDYLSILSAQHILTETLFTLCLSLTALTGLLLVVEPRPSLQVAGLHGLCLALTILVRPIAYYAPVCLLVFYPIIWRVQRGWAWKKILCFLSVWFLPLLIMIGGWQIRNYVVSGSAKFTLIQGANLYFYRGADIVAQRDQISFAQAQRQLGYQRYKELEKQPQMSGQTLVELNRHWQREGITLIREYPRLFLKGQIRGALSMLFETDWNAMLNHLRGQYPFASGPGGDLFRLSLSEYLHTWLLGRPLYVLLFGVAVMYLYLLYASVLYSLRKIWRSQSPLWAGHLLLWCMMFYLVLLSAGAQAYPRFRIPLMPFFALYAGHGCSLMPAALKRRVR